MENTELFEFMKEMRQDLKDDIKELRENIKAIENSCTEIPTMKLSLTNHLHTHDNITRYVLYPVGVLSIAAIATLFFKLVLHVF